MKVAFFALTDGNIFPVHFNEGGYHRMLTHESQKLIHKLLANRRENEWIEFKQNKSDPIMIGECVSALSNSAALHSQPKGYLIWGINDKSFEIVGTSFRPRIQKKGNQELESWLLVNLTPKIEISIHEEKIDNLHIVIFEIQAAFSYPVRFKDNEYIRVGSCNQKLKNYPEKERKLWDIFRCECFESGIAEEFLTKEQIFQRLDYSAYYILTEQPTPQNVDTIINRLLTEGIIKDVLPGKYAITNIGAILFANNLENYNQLKRKALRVIKYKGSNRTETVKEYLFKKGYATAFKEIIEYVNNQLPSNEEIVQALRREVRVYPEIAIRELVSNALIHQDFSSTGNGPTVEIFENRIEITNPGCPLINTLRFIDEPPRSRNELLAGLMRRMNICEERGSGIDKVISEVELYQLPPPDFRVTDANTISVLFRIPNVKNMAKEDKVRACYQHACLKWVSGCQMSNSSLRKRLGISDKNYPAASRIIRDTIKAELIKPYGDQDGNKNKKYIPFWA